MEKRSQWRFDPSDDGWVWAVLHSDGTSATSSKAWSTLKACVDDATQHGYVAWKAEDERRRAQMLGVSEVLKRKKA